MKVLFTGGGTGGHILPIIAVARELRKLQSNSVQQQKTTNSLKLFYMGPKDNFSDMLLSQEGIKVFHILAGKVRRHNFFLNLAQNILDTVIKTPLGVLQAFFKMFFLAPDIVFSKGGYGAVPSAISAWVLRTPLILHESDSLPGLANKITAKFASVVFTSFLNTKGFPKNKTQVVGNPIREDLLSGSKEEAKQIFKLQGEKPVVLVMGGSQGSQRINDMILTMAKDALLEYEIIHQTGEKNQKQQETEARVAIPENLIALYHSTGFLKETELRHAYAVSSLIINRAGSGAIFEIASLGKPSILVPLPEAAQNHQIENAYAYEKTGACIVLEETNLKPNFFLERIKSILKNPAEYKRMSKAALEFSKPNAAKDIAQYIATFLSNSN